MRSTFPLELALHRLDCLGSHRRLDVYDFLVEKAEELEAQPEIRPPLLTGNDLIAIRSIIRLTLGYDHRIVDGADADKFMVAVRNYLENWSEEIG